jgi:hypothetical protein
MFRRGIMDTPSHAGAATMDQSKQVDCGGQSIPPPVDVGPLKTYRKSDRRLPPRSAGAAISLRFRTARADREDDIGSLLRVTSKYTTFIWTG